MIICKILSRFFFKMNGPTKFCKDKMLVLNFIINKSKVGNSESPLIVFYTLTDPKCRIMNFYQYFILAK